MISVMVKESTRLCNLYFYLSLILSYNMKPNCIKLIHYSNLTFKSITMASENNINLRQSSWYLSEYHFHDVLHVSIVTCLFMETTWTSIKMDLENKQRWELFTMLSIIACNVIVIGYDTCFAKYKLTIYVSCF